MADFEEPYAVVNGQRFTLNFLWHLNDAQIRYPSPYLPKIEDMVFWDRLDSRERRRIEGYFGPDGFYTITANFPDFVYRTFLRHGTADKVDLQMMDTLREWKRLPDNVKLILKHRYFDDEGFLKRDAVRN